MFKSGSTRTAYHRVCPSWLNSYCKGQGTSDTRPSFGGLGVAMPVTCGNWDIHNCKKPLRGLKHPCVSTGAATRLVVCKCCFPLGIPASFFSHSAGRATHHPVPWHHLSSSATCQKGTQPQGENLHPVTAQRHANQHD